MFSVCYAIADCMLAIDAILQSKLNSQKLEEKKQKFYFSVRRMKRAELGKFCVYSLERLGLE